MLLIIAYSTGEEYPHTHVMIGYAIVILFAVGLFWLAVKPHDGGGPSRTYTPAALKAHLKKADMRTITLVSLFAVIAALPFCALLIMLLTHSVWGATWIDEMHEVVAYFAVGLVVVMVGFASSGYVEHHLRKIF